MGETGNSFWVERCPAEHETGGGSWEWSFLSMYSFSLLWITFLCPSFSLPLIAHFSLPFLPSPAFLMPALCQCLAGCPVSQSGWVAVCRGLRVPWPGQTAGAATLHSPRGSHSRTQHLPHSIADGQTNPHCTPENWLMVLYLSFL